MEPDKPALKQPKGFIHRALFAALGALFFAIGFIGAFLPVLPTTPFMLLAIWAFSKSSKRLHDYVWNHPRFGQTVRDWKLHGQLPRRAKIGAVLVMSVSALFLIFFSNAPWWGTLAAIVVMCISGTWLWTRPEPE